MAGPGRGRAPRPGCGSGESVTSSWHSVWERSWASSSPRWVGLPPTITAPARAAPPIQKMNSGTLSSIRATWNGPGLPEQRQDGGPLGLGPDHLGRGWKVRSPKASPTLSSPVRRRINSSTGHPSPWSWPGVPGRGRPGLISADRADSRCMWPVREGKAQIWNALQLSNVPCYRETGPVRSERSTTVMEFGVFLNGYLPGQAAHDPECEHEMLKREIAYVVEADKYNWKYAWVGEHHSLTEYSPMSAPEVVMGYLAHATERIHVGTGIMNISPRVSYPARCAERNEGRSPVRGPVRAGNRRGAGEPRDRRLQHPR